MADAAADAVIDGYNGIRDGFVVVLALAIVAGWRLASAYVISGGCLLLLEVSTVHHSWSLWHAVQWRRQEWLVSQMGVLGPEGGVVVGTWTPHARRTPHGHFGPGFPKQDDVGGSRYRLSVGGRLHCCLQELQPQSGSGRFS